MVTMTCKCGKSTMTFAKMVESDFGKDGWINDCCLEAREEAPIEPKKPEVEEVAVEAPPAPEAKPEPVKAPAKKGRKKKSAPVAE